MKEHVKFGLSVLVVIAVVAFALKLVPSVREKVAPWLMF